MESTKRFLTAFIFVAGLVTSNVFCALRSKMASGGVINDASDVTWAHAVNSKDALEKALAGPIDFLEADVSLGHVQGMVQSLTIPIMAHPPERSSDISLDTWLNTVVTRRPEKGIKLDFKSIEVVEPSLIILQKYSSKLNGSLWLSADVLPGPVHPRGTPLQSDYFFALCKRHFPRATLSLGWTTYWIKRFPMDSWQYEWQHVRQMADIVRCWYNDKTTPPITFSVRGIFASRSIKQLQWLLNTIPKSTLTVWTATGDSVDAEDFLRIQRSFPVERVYFDIPETLYKPSSKFRANSVPKKMYVSGKSKWVSVTRNQDKTCESFTYTDDNFILFGRPSNSAVLQKSLIPVDARNRNFSLTGRLKFFAGEHVLNPTHWEHKLNIVFGDINRWSKHAMYYSKKKLTFSVRDPETLWHAVNSSVLYTFEHTYFHDNTACRMFKLDVNSNLTFEAWTIPCDVTYEDQSYEEVSKGSISEVALEEILDEQDRMFMVGFHSFGEEYVLVYDINVSTEENVIEPSLDLPKLKLALKSAENQLNYNLTLMLVIFLTITICSYDDWPWIFLL